MYDALTFKTCAARVPAMEVLTSSESFFTHKDEFFGLLRQLVESTDEEVAERLVENIADIVRSSRVVVCVVV